MKSLKILLKKFFIILNDKHFMKGISTMVGAACLNFLVGSIFSLCTLSIYEISYIKAKGGLINIDHLTFYYPVEIFFQCISAFASGLIYKEMGLHITNLIGVTILSLGYFIMFISRSLGFDLLSMILGGIGTGIIFYPSTTNALCWFKSNPGLIVGTMETMISFGSFFFSFIGEMIINKNEIQSDEEDNLYEFDVAKRIKFYLIIQIITLISTYGISYLLMYEKEDDIDILTVIDEDFTIEKKENDKIEESKENNLNKEKKEENDKTLKINIKESKDNIGKYNKKENEVKESTNNEIKKEKTSENIDIKEEKKEPLLDNSNVNNSSINYTKKEKKDIKEMLKIAFKSKRLMLFSAIVILQAPVSNMAFALYREIGEYKKIDTKYLQLIGSLYFIFECLSSFVFGVLCDYFQLKNLLFFINGVGTAIGFIYCLTFKNGLIFFLVQNLLSFSAGGYYPVKDCYLMKVYGKDLYIELSGYVSFLVAFAVNLITPISFFVKSFMEDKEMAYWILFLTFGSLNLIGLILNFFLKETPINLEQIIKEKNIK